MTIGTLPDVALLRIFDFYVDERWIEGWCILVHVCRKWRNVVFGSPRRLNLRLYCEASTPVGKMLDVWPPFPIVIKVYGYEIRALWWGMENVTEALKHNDRMQRIELSDVSRSRFENALAAMQQPFPTLTYLLLESGGDETVLVQPDSFLGGSAPCLQELFLRRIPFPGVPKLLLSTTHLVHLRLWGIPHSGYFSPEAVATGLSVLIRLESLIISFESPRSRPDQSNRRPPPPTRTLLPVLTELWFEGVSDYLEDLVARINAPLLDELRIKFFHQLIFDTPQLTQFINRTPKFKAHDEACVFFSDRDVSFTLPQTSDGRLRLEISCTQPDWQLSSLAQICSSSFPEALFPTVERLYIHCSISLLRWPDEIDSGQWLELLHPFIAAKALYISTEVAPRIIPTLQELSRERVTDVLSNMQTLFVEETLSEPAQKAIWRFVAARQFAGHPIAVSRWERSQANWY